MITRRNVFKSDLCSSCSHFKKAKFQDGQVFVKCSHEYPITPNNLVAECRNYSNELKNTFWEAFEQQTAEIPIIGQKKVAKAGFNAGEK